jgi:hypothetical protein
MQPTMNSSLHCAKSIVTNIVPTVAATLVADFADAYFFDHYCLAPCTLRANDQRLYAASINRRACSIRIVSAASFGSNIRREHYI